MTRYGRIFADVARGQDQQEPVARIADALAAAMIRLDLPPHSTTCWTVRGRRSGRLLTTPVSVVIDGDQRWLVGDYLVEIDIGIWEQKLNDEN